MSPSGDYRNPRPLALSLFTPVLVLISAFSLTASVSRGDCGVQPPTEVREELVNPDGLNAGVAATPAGDFIVTWQTTTYQLGQDFVCDVRARRFCADGSTLGDEGVLSSQGDPGGKHHDPSVQCTRGGHGK